MAASPAASLPASSIGKATCFATTPDRDFFDFLILMMMKTMIAMNNRKQKTPVRSGPGPSGPSDDEPCDEVPPAL
jgi:hypothetical protein